jgi:AcrR family transcriptional regulator
VTVAEIASRAGVAIQTVYSSAGGKADILHELVDEAITSAGAAETVAAVRRSTDLATGLRMIGHSTRMGNERLADAVNVIYSAMTAHEDAERLWQENTKEYRASLQEAAAHFAAIGALGAGLTVDRAADMLWFCFGLGAWRCLIKESGWSWDQAEDWLTRQAERMLAGGITGDGIPSEGIS